MINLKTDKVLESSVPIPLLVRADEVIEQATLLRRVSLVLCRVSDTGPLDDLSSGAEGRCPKAFREGTRGGSADGLPSMGI